MAGLTSDDASEGRRHGTPSATRRRAGTATVLGAWRLQVVSLADLTCRSLLPGISGEPAVPSTVYTTPGFASSPRLVHED